MRNASGDGDLLHLDAPQVPGAPLRRYGHVDLAEQRCRAQRSSVSRRYAAGVRAEVRE